MQYQVQDIMNRNVTTAKPDMTCEELQDLLVINKITGVPVVNEKKAVLGVITLFNILNTELNTLYSPNFYTCTNIEQELKREDFHLGKPSEGYVSDFMTHQVIKAYPATSIEELGEIMYNYRTHRVIIVEPRTHKVLGIVTSFELIKLVRGGILKTCRGREKTLSGACSNLKKKLNT